jgi:hypothetical protein
MLIHAKHLTLKFVKDWTHFLYRYQRSFSHMLICSLIDNAISSDIVTMSAIKCKDGRKLLSIAKGVVTDLNGYDVLLGRGMPILKMAGNSRFRTLIVNHRDEYRASNRHAFKDEIARRIYLTIRALGGRFLRQIESSIEKERLKIGDDDSAWIVVDEETSLQKIKQALRELPWNAEPRRPTKNIDVNAESAIQFESEPMSASYPLTNLPEFFPTDDGTMHGSYRDDMFSIKRRKLTHYPQKIGSRSRDDEFLFRNTKYLEGLPIYSQRKREDLSLRNVSLANQLRMLHHHQARITDNKNEPKHRPYSQFNETKRKNPSGIQGQLYSTAPFTLPVDDSYNPLPRLPIPIRRNNYRYVPIDRSSSFPPSTTMRAQRAPSDGYYSEYSSMRQGRSELRVDGKGKTSPSSNKDESAQKSKANSSSNSSSPSADARKE